MNSKLSDPAPDTKSISVLEYRKAQRGNFLGFLRLKVGDQGNAAPVVAAHRALDLLLDRNDRGEVFDA